MGFHISLFYFRGIATDVCVPISRLAECILETRQDIDQEGLTVPIVGHVGDGNFHLLFMIDPENEKEDLKRYQPLNDRLVERTLRMGGTCTGEHLSLIHISEPTRPY